MKAYEAAKLLKMDNKTFLETYGIKSHLSKLPEELEHELFGDEKKIEEARPETEAAVDIPEADVVEEMPDERLIRKSIRCLGNKSPYWKWRDKIG